MVLAELEVFHSRPIAPTRRLALGDSTLPVDPAPGFGGVLLGGVAARFGPQIDPDLLGELFALVEQVEAGYRIPQPRLRHRLQEDRVGLARSRHRLHRAGERVRFEFEVDRAAPAQHVLAAVYAAGRIDRPARVAVMTSIRRGLRWTGGIGAALVSHLSAGTGHAAWAVPADGDPTTWALGVLGLSQGPDGVRVPSRSSVQVRFRELLREAHPDHGGEEDMAAARIRDLTEARRILLS